MASVQKRNYGRVGFRRLDQHDDVTLYPGEWFGDGKTKSSDALLHHRPKLFRVLANCSLIKDSQKMIFCKKQAFHFYISV